MFSGFVKLLWVTTILCFIVYGNDSSQGPSPDNLYMGGALTFVVVVYSLISFY